MRSLFLLALGAAMVAGKDLGTPCPPETCKGCKGGCVKGSLFECLVNPCDANPCKPGRKCVPNYCNGCNACCEKCDIPKDWTVISSKPCTAITYLCLAGFEPWSNECGCGCKPVETDAPAVFCTDDAKLCPDGSYVSRDPKNNCQFPPCPCNIPKDWTVISSKPCTAINYLCLAGFEPWSNECGCGCKPVPTTDAPAVFCTQDVKTCPDGSYVSRDPANGCAFRECPNEPKKCTGCPQLRCASRECPNKPGACYGCCTDQCYLDSQGNCGGITPIEACPFL